MKLSSADMSWELTKYILQYKHLNSVGNNFWLVHVSGKDENIFF